MENESLKEEKILINKKRLYSIMYLVSLVLLINSLPFSLFIKNEIILFVIDLIIKIASIIYIIIYIKKEDINKLSFEKLTPKDLKFLPLLLLCCSNFFVVMLQNFTLKGEIDLFKIITGLFLSMGVAIVEELLFRSQVLEEFLKHKNKFSSILYSSLIFGSVHLLNISSLSSIPMVLVQVCYTFFLGMILGIIYVFRKNIILPIIFHFSFNFLNDILVIELFVIKWDFLFFLVNIILGIILILYVIYLVYISKKGVDIDVT